MLIKPLSPSPRVQARGSRARRARTAALDYRRILRAFNRRRNGMRGTRVTRRRRRYGRGSPLDGLSRLSPRTLMITAGVGVIALFGGFFYLVNMADGVKPPQTEKRIELPNAFKS
jgi:hypothetical protein